MYGDGTAAALDAYTKSEGYGGGERPWIYAALVFHAIPAGAQQGVGGWDYSPSKHFSASRALRRPLLTPSAIA